MLLIRNTGEKYNYHGDGLLDGGMGGHAQVVVAAPHSDLLRTPRELPEKNGNFSFKIQMTKFTKSREGMNCSGPNRKDLDPFLKDELFVETNKKNRNQPDLGSNNLIF
jgi:hypothetical protein